MREEVARYRTVENVHDLPFIFHHWSNRYVLPKLQEVAGVFSTRSPASLSRRSSPGARPALRRGPSAWSRGSGNGDLELQVAQCVVASGHRNVHFTCLELNAEMQHRARAAAAGAGLEDLFEFVEADLNAWSPPSSATYTWPTIPSTTCSRSSTCSRR